ncbi:MAG: hypothetical protein DRR19_06950 [Candidatus Parabeggiatoa sp. nov. 1]|nr:MAG: hypothetical protein DRR19_06950 [Gammaproteobacteria bacterium]
MKFIALVGILIAMIAVVAEVATPEIRCKLGLDKCVEEPDSQRAQQLELEQQRAELEREKSRLREEARQIEQARLRAEQQAKQIELAILRAEQEARRAAEQARLKASYRYADNGNGTVTDNKTALIWLKNANCFGRQNWKTAMQKAANLASGRCGLRDGSTRGMWRLPTKEEWEAMIDDKYVKKDWSQPALSNAAGTGPWQEGDAFSGVQAYLYWSSASYAGDTSYAWDVSLHYGDVYSYDKTNTRYVWPVRGGD